MARTMLVAVSTLVFGLAAHAAAPAEMRRVDPLYKQLAQLKQAAYDVNTVKTLAGKTGWKPYEGNPVIRLGKKGRWDAGALGSMSVLKVGNIYHIYYEAWGTRGTKWSRSDYQSLQVGHAVSPDGVHWIKDPANPVLPKGNEPNDWDKDGTWDPFVIYEDGVFKMWYGGGVHPHCNWGFAVSKYGRRFKKKGRISNLNHVEDDHVVHNKQTGKYYMYYIGQKARTAGAFPGRVA